LTPPSNKRPGATIRGNTVCDIFSVSSKVFSHPKKPDNTFFNFRQKIHPKNFLFEIIQKINLFIQKPQISSPIKKSQAIVDKY
jgi:hypothetical protein